MGHQAVSESDVLPKKTVFNTLQRAARCSTFIFSPLPVARCYHWLRANTAKETGRPAVCSLKYNVTLFTRYNPIHRPSSSIDCIWDQAVAYARRLFFFCGCAKYLGRERVRLEDI